ncbi:MAG: Rieske 2Fe-2S domain-containing protein, partial [Actinomycetota bacterium]
MSSSEEPSTEPVDVPDGPHEWHKILDPEELPAGRVTTVTVGRRSLAVANVDGTFGAMDNHCP